MTGGQPTAPGDIAVRNRLISLGHTVTTVLDSAGTASDTVGKNLGVISSSVQSTDMANYAINSLATLPLPIINYEPALYDELLMSASGNNVVSQTSLIITDPTHPLAGFSGTKVVYNTPDQMAFGVAFTLGTDATVVATSEAGDPAIFAYSSLRFAHVSRTAFSSPCGRCAFFVEVRGLSPQSRRSRMSAPRP